MQKWTKPDQAPIQIALLLFDRFSNLCMANCIEPLRAANTQTLRENFHWMIYTVDGAPASSSSGIEVVAHANLAELTKVDYLFVLASYNHDEHDRRETRRILRSATAKASTVVGLDAGPWLLASAGLLDGRRATIHWDLLDAFSERFLEVRAEREQVLHDGPYMTCAGAMSAMEMTLGLIEHHLGAASRLDVEALFLHGSQSGETRSSQNTSSDPLTKRALQLMRENIEKPLSLAELSHRLSCQPRTLSRRFQTRLGASPGTVYRHMRLAAARKLLESSTLSVSETALRCGYDSPAAMARAIRKYYGLSPTQLRLKARSIIQQV